MSFRRRLLLLFAITVIVSVAAVSGIVALLARRAFDRANNEQTSALLSQFQQEFTRRGEEVSRRVQAASTTPGFARITIAAAQSAPQYNAFVDDAQSVAEIEQLDFLEFVDDRGIIISSAQWPAKFGYQEPLASSGAPTGPFLKDEETPSGHALGLFAIRAVPAGDRKLYLIGGIRLDAAFLSTLRLPSGMRVLLYENLEQPGEGFSPAHLLTAGNSLEDPQQLAPLVRDIESSQRESVAIIPWQSGSSETFHAIPLAGADKRVLGVLLIGNSRRIYTEFRDQIRSAALLASGVGLLLAVLLSSWAAARVTRPVEQLAHAAREIAAGNWNATVTTDSKDEIGELADAFTRMTRDLLEQRERLVQTERVAAWRELARRLAHELKNPLFPMQLTVENLLRSREHGDQQFDETFRESTTTLLSEISNLKRIIGRFSEFSKMPQPQWQPVDVNALLGSAIKVFQAQLDAAGIVCRIESSATQSVTADPDLLHRAVSNLIANAIDAMPQGGTLTLRTRQTNDGAFIEVSDTGGGISRDALDRLFTPYFTSKPQGTGLGLAIVQSIVSDHGGKISVNSEPGKGATFIIELPLHREIDSAIAKN